MNLRCTYCQTPFSLGRMEKLAALQRMEAENLHHYDAFCPRCRRANSISRQRLEQFTPGWQEGLKTLEVEAARIEKVSTEPAPPAPVKMEPVAAAPLEATRNRHTSKSKVAAPAPAESRPTAEPASKSGSVASLTKGAKPVTKSKPATAVSTKEKKPSTKVKPSAAKKPAAKKK